MATNPVNEILQHLRRSELLCEGEQHTDGQLLDSFVRRRDGVALEAIVRRHGPMVWGVCRRVLRNLHDAEDAFQATFLVLVRKAASIRSRELLANWLYGVAQQTARKARQTAARRQAREKQVTAMPEPHVGSQDQDLWPDLEPLLDEELSRLPDKYRAAVVFCDLQGKTRAEAARQLNLPEGTVASRLARARAMLAKRLARRGLTVSGAALAAVLSQQEASASVPTAVQCATLNSASLLAAGETAAGVISTQVSALTEGVLKAMFLTKLKIGALLLLGAVCAATGVFAYDRTVGQREPARAEAATPNTPPPGGKAKGHPEPGDRWRNAAQRPKLSDREKAAYEQLAKVHLCAFTNVTWTARSFLDLRKDSAGPMDALYRMGFDVLPQLAEALEDDTPTRTVTTSYSARFPKGAGGYQKAWRVNELVARLVVELASHDFVLDPDADGFPPGVRDLNEQPSSPADYKKAVLAWYAANRDRTPVERKISDVSDRWFRNRFDAVEWLGENRSEAGRRAIGKRVDALLVEGKTQENSTLWAEMSLCAEVLGKIGDRESLARVRAVCGFLSSDDRWATGGAGPNPSRHFEAYHGLALLGEKDEALRGLKAVYENRKDRLPDPEMIPGLLERASRW